VFDSVVLRKIFGLGREELTGNWTKSTLSLSFPNIIQVIESRKMRWAEHVACMGKRETYKAFKCENLKKRTTWKT
jgi:hypothetical protein